MTFGGIDIDYWHWIDNFRIIDIETGHLWTIGPQTIGQLFDATIDIEVTTHNYWPYYIKSIIIDKSQYIDIEEYRDIDIVIDIDDGQWQLVNIDIGYWHWLLKIIDIGPKILI